MPRRQIQDDNDDDHEEVAVDKDEDLPVLEESGLTEEERRQIRKKQRQLNKELEETNMEVEEARDRNNEIYKRVRYTREAVLDGENMIAIANKASQKVDRLIQVPRYDADRLVHKLKERVRMETGGGSEAQFDWSILGEAAGACFNALPSDVCFLNGPLMHGQPPVQRRAAVRRRVEEDEEAEEQRPEDVKGHTERDDNKLSAIEKSMKDMSKVLQKKVNARHTDMKAKLQKVYGDDVPKEVMKKAKRFGVEIDAFQFLFNPESFTQTVENIFHYSFLIKKGTASIAVREKGLQMEGLDTKPGLTLKYVKDTASHSKAKQGILSLTMQDWRDLCEAYQVEECDLPHRKINKEAYSASLSQANS